MKSLTRLCILGTVGIGVVGFVILMSWALSNKTPVTGTSGLSRVGQPAAQFSLPLFNGSRLNLSDHMGKAIVINFWASWCLPCREEAVDLERTWNAHKSSNVLFIGINIQDSHDAAMEFIKEFGVTYPNGSDAKGKITIDYGVVGLPVTFFVGTDGVVQRRWVGPVSESILVSWIETPISRIFLNGSFPVGNFN